MKSKNLGPSFLTVVLLCERPGTNELQISEAYSKPCHTSKIEYFAKIVKAVNYFRKALHLRFWQGSKHAPV